MINIDIIPCTLIFHQFRFLDDIPPVEFTTRRVSIPIVINISTQITPIDIESIAITSYLGKKPKSTCMLWPNSNKFGIINRIVKIIFTIKPNVQNISQKIRPLASFFIKPGRENLKNCNAINGKIVMNPSNAPLNHLTSLHFAGL